MTEETLSGKVVAVTGGAGFIGSHLCDSLLGRVPDALLIIDNFSLGKGSNVAHLSKNDRVRTYKMDATDYKSMLELFCTRHVDVVFNLAVVPLPASLDQPKICIDQNILVTSTLCELLLRKKFKTLIHCSSSETYGTAIYVPMDEIHPTEPITPYAASKIACDYVALSYYKTFQLDIAIVRPFNTYGPRQNDGSYAAVIPETIRRIMQGKTPVIYGDGLQTRDFSYVEDIAEAIPRIYEATSTRGKVVNLASGREVPIKSLIETIMRLMNYTGEISYQGRRPGDVRRHRGDITLAQSLIGYFPKTDYAAGLTKTIQWYRSLPEMCS
jgi:UDP-glucose 4-epimerase